MEYVSRFLTQENATLPRILVRSAECALLAGIDFPRPILDIGSGDGTFARTLFDEPIDVGVDTSRPQMIRSLRLHTYRSLVETSGDRLPFPDAVFGSVISNSTLEHISNAWDVIREAGRVLRPGGVFVMTVPSEHFAEYLAGSRVMKAVGFALLGQAYEAFFNRICRHIHVKDPRTWMRWIDDAGLRVEEWRYYYSARDNMVLELSHYLAAPSVVTRAVLGRWVLWPGKSRYIPLERLIVPFTSPGRPDDGAFIFFRCRKP